MRYILKFSALGICAISLSGCAFTQGVLQGAYDEKAEKNCRTDFGSPDSIHKSAKSNCKNGYYEPKDKSKSDKDRRE